MQNIHELNILKYIVLFFFSKEVQTLNWTLNTLGMKYIHDIMKLISVSFNLLICFFFKPLSSFKQSKI